MKKIIFFFVAKILKESKISDKRSKNYTKEGINPLIVMIDSEMKKSLFNVSFVKCICIYQI